MFTGLVEELGVVRRMERRRGAQRWRVECSWRDLVLGESIAVHGACLTVAEIVAGGFEADLSTETLARTSLGGRAVGDRVHLERATPLGGRMGGHMVLGHVDGVGAVASSQRGDDGTMALELRAPGELARFIAAKGSIAVDGVSLTVNTVIDEGREATRFSIMLVPHTLQRTTLGDLAANQTVNLEVDVLARYVQRQFEVERGGNASEGAGGSDADANLYAKLRSGGFA
ncbi:MAG: riboflavin synthase [Polyangiaceae bacterium]